MKLMFNMGYHFEAFYYLYASIQTAEDLRIAMNCSRKITRSYRNVKEYENFLGSLKDLNWKPSLRKL